MFVTNVTLEEVGRVSTARFTTTMRVMFVDDDPQALASLEDRLYALRSRWQMSFVCGIEDAVDRLGSHPVDVVVAESRMRMMSGVAFLARVRGAQPRAMRIIVSHPGDVVLHDAKTLAVVHQVLPKPCGAGQVEAIVERAATYRDLLTNDALRSSIAAIGGLPTMPALSATLASMVDDPRVSLDSIATLIESDAAITTRMLQLVNSAFFSRRRGITAVREAITLMGVDVVRVLVLTTEMFGMFDRGRTSPHFSLVELATSSLHAARAASHFAEGDPALRHLAGTAFSAAVLRDVGHIVMATAMPDLYDSAYLYAQTKRIPFHHAERLLLRYTHADVGAYLLALWGLPELLVDAVAYHHFPGQAPAGSAPLVRLVRDEG